MKKLLVYLLFLSGLCLITANANDPQDGYVIVKSDTIYGKINMNFESGAITVNQDSINRMYLTGIKKVTLLNEKRESYLPVTLEDKQTFYKLLVEGEYPLLTSEGVYLTIINDELIWIEEEKDLYGVFGKRNVKDYVFLRNISVNEEQGLMDVFQYFNQNKAF